MFLQNVVSQHRHYLVLEKNLKCETKPAFNVVVQLIYYSIDVNGQFITFRKIKWLPICLCSHDITIVESGVKHYKPYKPNQNVCEKLVAKKNSSLIKLPFIYNKF